MSWLMPLLLSQAMATPFSAFPVADEELAQMRGGFSLPNGIDVALAVQTQTTIDGAIVLRTVFQASEGPASFAAYVPAAGQNAADANVSQKAQTSSTTPVAIEFDNRNGFRFSPGVPLPVVGSGSQSEKIAEGTPAGFSEIGANGPTVTSAGVVTLSKIGSSYTATLDDTMLRVTHLAGQAFGSIVANSADNKAIDVETTIDLNLSGASPDVLGSAMFRVENTALDALRSRNQ
ncbi:hypothetical protein WG901_08705 [Novosphingobium sp. PS1R-30]|uniref:Uncharacterized protein n=1 Tax=Novosphingobium anseongense TaxID=3133436 RepID=A0ABU8RUG8_9SPHN